MPVSVQAAIWFGGIGFALFFGTMLVKVFRVYYIFRNVRLNKSVCSAIPESVHARDGHRNLVVLHSSTFILL